MASNRNELRIALFEDGTHAVLRTDSVNPRLMEVIATFYDAAHARDFISLKSAPATEAEEEQRHAVTQAAKRKPAKTLAAISRQPSRAKPKQLPASGAALAVQAKPKRTTEAQRKKAPEAKSKGDVAEMSDRQTAVLKALRSLMDKKKRVEVRAAVLAKASSVPLGSLHSILASLEKKQMIRTERQGSPKFSAIYELLEAPRKTKPSLNGVAHIKGVSAHVSR
jgi:uncharacterized membrane protein